ncbi:MAG: hypothetical protein IJ399_01710 [Bacilli bacterium]|nr:hypothetical protein [Bacilli bacterium]
MKYFNISNISSIAKSTSSVLNVLKKTIPVYKEIKPIFSKKDNPKNIESVKKESNLEYNDSLTFFK